MHITYLSSNWQTATIEEIWAGVTLSPDPNTFSMYPLDRQWKLIRSSSRIIWVVFVRSIWKQVHGENTVGDPRKDFLCALSALPIEMWNIPGHRIAAMISPNLAPWGTFLHVRNALKPSDKMITYRCPQCCFNWLCYWNLHQQSGTLICAPLQLLVSKMV
jgi:hypothetical protein